MLGFCSYICYRNLLLMWLYFTYIVVVVVFVCLFVFGFPISILAQIWEKFEKSTHSYILHFIGGHSFIYQEADFAICWRHVPVGFFCTECPPPGYENPRMSPWRDAPLDFQGGGIGSWGKDGFFFHSPTGVDFFKTRGPIKCTKESDRNHSALRTSKQHEQNKMTDCFE